MYVDGEDFEPYWPNAKREVPCIMFNTSYRGAIVHDWRITCTWDELKEKCRRMNERYKSLKGAPVNF
jgi:hypothetical protein